MLKLLLSAIRTVLVTLIDSLLHRHSVQYG